jgi:L-fucose mutarotase
MLKGISPLISPDLLKIIAEMGHGDEIVLADAHFPGHSTGRTVLRADGATVDQLIDALLPLFELDSYDVPLIMMAPVEGDALDPNVEEAYSRTVADYQDNVPPPERLERFAFYERAGRAYAIVVTGDRRKYANLILKKGVTP